MRCLRVTASVLFLVIAAPRAGAVTIDFESLAANTLVSNQFAGSGITFSGVAYTSNEPFALGQITGAGFNPGSRLLGNSFPNPFGESFSFAFAPSVGPVTSVSFVAFNDEADNPGTNRIQITVNTTGGGQAVLPLVDASPARLVTLDFPTGIESVELAPESAWLFWIDNVTYEPGGSGGGNPVAEPASLSLAAAAGLAAAFRCARRGGRRRA